MVFTVEYSELEGDGGEPRWTFAIVEDGGYRYPGSDARSFATEQEAQAEAQSALAALQRFGEIPPNA